MSKSNFSNEYVNHPKKIYVLDAPSLERERLIRFLEKSDFSVSKFSTPAEFFQEKTIHHGTPSVLFANIALPNMTGIDLLERSKMMQLNIPVVFYGQAHSVPRGIAAVKQGALNFLLMPAKQESILQVIEDGFCFSMNAQTVSTPHESLHRKLSVLSPREQEVFFLLIKGYSNAELVSTLGISLDTAKQYKSSLMRKLEAKSLSQLMSLAAISVSHTPSTGRLEVRPS